jgi:hypothetical protein
LPDVKLGRHITLPTGNSDLAAMTMYDMTDLQYQAVLTHIAESRQLFQKIALESARNQPLRKWLIIVYNVLSFALASMMATTMLRFFRSFAVKAQYPSAVLISGLVTFIAAYHYIRIFDLWVGAYCYSTTQSSTSLTGVPSMMRTGAWIGF